MLMTQNVNSNVSRELGRVLNFSHPRYCPAPLVIPCRVYIIKEQAFGYEDVCAEKQWKKELCRLMGLNHAATMLSLEGLKTFFPNRGSVYEIYCLWPIWPPRE